MAVPIQSAPSCVGEPLYNGAYQHFIQERKLSPNSITSQASLLLVVFSSAFLSASLLRSMTNAASRYGKLLRDGVENRTYYPKQLTHFFPQAQRGGNSVL